MEEKLQECLLILSWEEIVGKKVATVSFPQTLRGGILFVGTVSSTWAQELSFQKGRILEKLRALVKEIRIHDIHFAPGEMKKRSPSRDPSPHYPALPPEDQAAIESFTSDLPTDLSPVIRQVMETAWSVKRSKMLGGGSSCPACAVPLAKNESCPFCQTRERNAMKEKISRLLRQSPWLSFDECKAFCPHLDRSLYSLQRDHLLLSLNEKLQGFLKIHRAGARQNSGAATQSVQSGFPTEDEVKEMVGSLQSLCMLLTGLPPHKLDWDELSHHIGKEFRPLLDHLRGR